MRRKNLSGIFFELSILTLVVLGALAPNAYGVVPADIAGTWSFNSFVSGLKAPWWERGTLTVEPDGTFSGSGTDSNGNPASVSGTFSVSSDGIVISGADYADAPLCRMDSGNAVLVCTHFSEAGSSNLTIFTKRTPSYSMSNLAGSWEASTLSSGPAPWWAIMAETIYPDGTFRGTVNLSEGSSTSVSGQLSIAPSGAITCLAGFCPGSLDSFTAFMDQGKTVSVGTGWSIPGREALFSIMAKQAASYALDDLARCD
ncbi:MAG: hypothetical protein P4L55_00780 [Syntrophobacteraceae bacterium]|nr:hypothetical protein [Syntrophobacteraceae bacterium]